MRLRRISGLLVLGLAIAPPGSAQMGDGSQTMALGSGRAVRGTVTAATADHLTVKTEAGEVYEVVVTPNTQVRKGRDPMKFGDIHTGDAVGAMGEIDAPKKTVHALMVVVVDAEQLKKAREAMGKTVISGTVTAIDDVKITIKRTDDVMQTIMVDEDTSFRKGGRNMAMALGADGAGGMRPQRAGAAAPANADTAESLTLADVKVGSVVVGQGAIKNGIFVPTQLAVSDAAAQQQRRRRPEGAAGTPGTSTTTPATTTPPTTGTEPK
jgi:hypothetical protein